MEPEYWKAKCRACGWHGSSEECDVPPIGWRCTRGKGHEGPCAAVECPEDIELVERGMKRLRETDNAVLGLED